MSDQGAYDPNSFVAGVFATYPAITDPPGGELYQPGMFWTFDQGGFFDGTPVELNDQVWVEGRARLFGDLLFGREVFGGPAGSDWPVELTSWVIVFTGVPWRQTPPPGAGCPVSDGFRFVLEALQFDFVEITDSVWFDITPTAIQSSVIRGSTIPGPVFPIEEIVTDFTEQFDPDGLLQVSTFIRAGLLGPAGDYQALSTCRIARLSDVTDAAVPARSRIASYGLTSDTVAVRPDWDRPAEPAATRLQAIIDALGWVWAPITFEDSPGLDMRNEQNVPAELRLELDRIALSSRWAMDTGRDGTVRFRNWPLTAPAPALVRFVDCDQSVRFAELVGDWDPATGSWPGQFRLLWNDANDAQLWNDAGNPTLWAGDETGPYWRVSADGTTPDGIDVLVDDLVGFFDGRWWPVLTGAARTYTQIWLNDRAELCNLANAGTTQPGDNAQAFDQASIDKYGERSVGYGMPAVALATADINDMQALASSVIARAGNLIRRAGGCSVSTANGPDAWQALRLDIGDPVEVTALTPEFRRQELSMVLGINHSITPGDVRARFNLTLGTDPA